MTDQATSRFLTHRRISLKVVILIALTGAGILPPFAFLTYASLHQFDPSGAFGALSLEHFAAIFTSRAFGPTLLNSVLYSLGSALLALALGAAQAWLAERTDARLRQVLYVASIVSLGVPYILYIVAWLLLLSKAGPVNAILHQLFGGNGPYINVYSLGGMIFIEGMLWSPLAFLLLCPVFRNSDASFEEAAATCGAGVFATLRYVTLGMVRPALLALGLLVFIKASEAFEVPALVGLPGSKRVLTSTIYQTLTLSIPPDNGSASAFGVLLLIIMAILLQIYNRVAAQTYRYQTVTGKGFRPRVVRLGRWRYAAGALIVAIPLVVIVIPLATILWAALLPYYQPFSVAALPLLGFGNFTQVLNAQSFRDSIANTLMLGASAATIVTLVSAVAGWCVARRVPGSRLLDALVALPLVFPAIVLGLAFLQIFVHAGTLIYGSLLSLVIVSIVAYMPYGLRYAQLGVIQIHPELEEAAAVAGARQARTFIRVVLPLLVPGADLVLAVRVPARGPCRLADAATGRAGLANRGRDAVRLLEQRTDRRTRRAWLRVDGNYDGLQRRVPRAGATLSTADRLKAQRAPVLAPSIDRGGVASATGRSSALSAPSASTSPAPNMTSLPFGPRSRAVDCRNGAHLRRIEAWFALQQERGDAGHERGRVGRPRADLVKTIRDRDQESSTRRRDGDMTSAIGLLENPCLLHPARACHRDHIRIGRRKERRRFPARRCRRQQSARCPCSVAASSVRDVMGGSDGPAKLILITLRAIRCRPIPIPSRMFQVAPVPVGPNTRAARMRASGGRAEDRALRHDQAGNGCPVLGETRQERDRIVGVGDSAVELRMQWIDAGIDHSDQDVFALRAWRACRRQMQACRSGIASGRARWSMPAATRRDSSAARRSPAASPSSCAHHGTVTTERRSLIRQRVQGIAAQAQRPGSPIGSAGRAARYRCSVRRS